jgi:hypothetical protein
MIQKYAKRPVVHVKVCRDGREICNLKTAAGDREYKRRTMEMRTRQRNICPVCTLYLEEEDTTFDHEIPRGHGGGSRDDRIWVEDEDGVIQPRNFATHYKCNGERGSKRNLQH